MTNAKPIRTWIASPRSLAYYFWKLQARMVKQDYKLLRHRRFTPLR
ncbi:MAG: hypothetical protein RBS36_00285 [Thiomicrospira sp.]|nr:hypothetical protein [Thiomicrospira sp.]